MQPEAAAALGRRQAEALVETGAELVVSADHTCIDQLRRHLRELKSPLTVHHPIEVLARSIDAGQALSDYQLFRTRGSRSRPASRCRC